MKTGNMTKELQELPNDVNSLIDDTVKYFPDIKLTECFPMTFYRMIEIDKKIYKMQIIINVNEIRKEI